VADRTVKVTLIANATGYVAGMDQATRKTRELGSEAERLAQKRAAFEGIGRGLLAIGIAAAIGVGFAISKFIEFDQAMSQVNAVTQETAANQELLRDAALEAGGATVFTAREAANALEELAKAGLSTSVILGGALTGSLDLAAAGQLEVARSAEIMGITLKQFNLDGTQAGRVADVLAAGANKAVGGVEELAQGLKFVGPVADSMNVSLEDTVATLTLFADRGILGEQAGTSLRGMLASLTSPSKEAKNELDRLGVTLYDSQGRFLGLENTAGELHRTLGDVTDAERDMSLGIIFGNMQVTAARTVVSAGAETWRDYRAAVDDTGIAARIAAERMDNLAGDAEKLGGALDTALIQSGSGANDVLRSIVQSVTWLVDLVGGLPEPVLAVGLAFTIAAAGVTLLSGAALLAIPRLADLRGWMQATGISAGGLAAKLAGATAALTVVSLVVGLFIGQAASAAASADAFADSLEQASGAATDYTRELAIKRLEEEGAFELAEKLGISQAELTDALIEGGSAWAEITKQLDEYTAATTTTNFADRQKFLHLRDIRGELDSGIEAWKNETAANAEAAAASEANAEALAVLEGQAGDTSGAIDELSDQILNFGKATLDTRDAERQFQAAIDDLTASVAENGKTLDVTTEAGRANESALDDLAEAALKRASAINTMTGDDEAARQAIADGREALINQLEAFGITGQAAEDYADALGLIPANINTALRINTGQAFAQLDALKAKLAGNKAALDSLNNWRPQGFSYNASGGMYESGVKAFASGGFASGMYPHTPGGIHKFAEAGDEAFISFLPQYAERNKAIVAESGQRLGMWQSAPAQYMTAPGSSSTGETELGPRTIRRLMEGLMAQRVMEADGQVIARTVNNGNAREAALGGR
jgi:TP901 family phage tail tape measure protein